MPLPSCPSMLPPQASTVPSASRARACVPPAAMAVTPVRPFTGTGMSLGVVVPLPSCPSMLSPQASTVPFASNASVNRCSRGDGPDPGQVRHSRGRVGLGHRGVAELPVRLRRPRPPPPSQQPQRGPALAGCPGCGREGGPGRAARARAQQGRESHHTGDADDVPQASPVSHSIAPITRDRRLPWDHRADWPGVWHAPYHEPRQRLVQFPRPPLGPGPAEGEQRLAGRLGHRGGHEPMDANAGPGLRVR